MAGVERWRQMITAGAHLLYGCKNDDLERAREILEDALGIQFTARDSSYLGPYFFFSSSSEKMTLRRNLDPLDGEPAELDFPAYKVLLYVSGAGRASPINASVEGKATQFTFLK